MLYLEDYLEMIEHLPQELRDRFTEMREMDLSVQNNMDDLEKRVKLFFGDCKRFPSNTELPPSIEAEFTAIRKVYDRTIEEADEKVHLANQMYELVDKYLRRLDTELHKFKCELEADNKGITEVLEKRSLELDTPVNSSSISSQQKENRYDSSFRYSRPRSEKRRDSSASMQTSYSEKRQAINPSMVDINRHSSSGHYTVVPSVPQPSQSSNVSAYNLAGHIGTGPIAAAASQAIALTQQLQQGRRTASLKASYEAISTGSHGHEFRELAGAAQIAIQAVQQDHANNKKKKKTSSSNTNSSSSTSSSSQVAVSSTVVPPAADSPSVDVAQADAGDADWQYDPNEPRYCLCNQVSYGDMVACDNADCPSEWFHYPCVGITAPPKGKWYCPECTASMKRRGGRKN